MKIFLHKVSSIYFLLILTASAYGQSITWTNLVGVEVQSNNTLVKTAGWGTDNGGAASSEVLPANTNGWAEFTAYATKHERYFGLSATDISATNNIDYAIKLSSDDNIVVWEGSLNRGTFGKVTDGDVLRVARVSDTIKYMKNDSIFYESNLLSTSSLLVDVCFYHSNGAIQNGMISFGTPVTIPAKPLNLTGTAGSTSVYLNWLDGSDNEEGFRLERSVNGSPFVEVAHVGMNSRSYTDTALNISTRYSYRLLSYNSAGNSEYSNTVTLTTKEDGSLGEHVTWTDLVGVSVQSDNSLIKTAGYGSDNGGATSVEILPENTDGWVEFTAYATSHERYLGFSNSNNGATNNIDFAIKLSSANGIVASEGGNNVHGLGMITNGDIIRIERAGGKIKYIINDSTHHISSQVSESALMVDASIYHKDGVLKDVKVSFAKLTLSAPSGLAATSWDENSISLSWDDVNNELTYVLERSDTPNSGFSEIVSLGENINTFTDQGLVADQTYYYRIKALGVNGNESEYSAEITASTSKQIASSSDFYQKPRYNGNISAVRWKLHGDKNQKVYTYHYDKAGRLTEAQYAEGSTVNGVWSTLEKLGGFNVHSLSYDHNGNINTLNRQAAEGSVTTIDQLDYSYIGNRLMAVKDDAGSAGFKDGNVNSGDYEYDDNGNVIKDLNQGIVSIEYNFMNLPERIDKSTGEYIIYGYDAAGAKLYEELYDQAGALVKRTDYLGGFVFENNELKLLHHAEGRVVPEKGGEGFEYQYDIKDHLGNSRVTFSSQPDEIVFSVNFENDPASPDDIDLFEETGPVVDNDLMNHTEPKDQASGETYSHSQMLNGAEGRRVGSLLAIPVGPGDKVTARAFAKYINATTNDVGQVTALGASLIAAFTGGVGTAGEYTSQSINGSFTGENGTIIGTSGFDVEDESAPYAFLNMLFLPEGEAVNIDQNHFAFDQIDIGAEQPLGNAINQPFDELLIEGFQAPQKGYMIIYVSNESNALVDVHFDDIEIKVEQHAIIQADDYYPFGLTFNSYKRVGRTKNDYLYQGKEKMENTEWYDFHARNYHAALGRFMQVDPAYNGPSGYVGMANNPVGTIDPDGRNPFLIAVGIAAAVSAVTYTASVAMSDGGFANWDWGQFTQNMMVGTVSGAFTFGIGSGFTAGTGYVLNNSQQAVREVARVATHAAFQGGISAAQGGNFWISAGSAIAGGAVGGATEGWTSTGGKLGTVGISMLLGGITSELSGGDFWKGAAMAGIVAGANHVAHRITMTPEQRSALKMQRTIRKLNRVIRKLLNGGEYEGFVEKDGNYYFEGVRVLARSYMVDGTAMALPEEIYVDPEILFDSKGNPDIDLLRHEFGHILQYRRYGWTLFLVVAPVSSVSTFIAPSHQHTWTEKEANTLSYLYFNMPEDWNFNRYPIDQEYLNGVIKENYFDKYGN